MASTLTTNAIDNAPTYATVPIYNTAGQLVASGSSQLWLSVFANPIGFDEFGNPSSTPRRGREQATAWPCILWENSLWNQATQIT